MKRKASLLIDPEFLDWVFGPEELSRIRSLVSLEERILSPRDYGKEEASLRNVKILLSGWGAPVMDEAFLKTFKSLEAVFYAGGTVRPIVTEAFWSRNITLITAASANAKPTAEFAFSQILFSLKRGWKHVSTPGKRRAWPVADSLMAGGYGSTVGLLSLGRTGRAVADFLRMTDVTVLAYDPTLSQADCLALGVLKADLEEVFRRSDVISCHMPLLEATRGAIGRAQFEAMKPGATFINTARGAVVREAEMADVLEARPDLQVLLDVTDPEPPARHSKLYKLPNVVLTPHIAGSLGPECRRMGAAIVKDLGKYLRGEALVDEVRRDHLSTCA